MTRHLDAYSIIAGAEPKFTGTVSKTVLINTLNWYSQNKTSKDAENYIHQYFKKILKQELPYEVYRDIQSTFGYACRMVINGATLPDENIEWFNNTVQVIQDKLNTKKSKKSPNKTDVDTTSKESVQDRIRERASEVIGELEGLFDEIVITKFKNIPSPKVAMHDRVKGVHTKYIIEWSKQKRAEYDNVLTTKDKDILEGYSNFSKPEIKKIIGFFDSVLKECMAISEDTTKQRKPRKRKVKSPEELVSKVKICVDFPDLDLKSLNPRDIIGAMQLWVYNTKYKKLGCYHAMDAQGLSVKGTTLLNYSEEKSVHKTLRKPQEVLPEVLECGKVALRNILTNIRAVEGSMNGRLNEDVVLLRVMK